jgi:hypothetical protein
VGGIDALETAATDAVGVEVLVKGAAHAASAIAATAAALTSLTRDETVIKGLSLQELRRRAGSGLGDNPVRRRTASKA